MKIDNLKITHEGFKFGSINNPQFSLGPINLEVEQGYIVGVIGRNGSGKSTLFDAMLGVNIEEAVIKDKSKAAYILEKCHHLSFFYSLNIISFLKQHDLSIIKQKLDN